MTGTLSAPCEHCPERHTLCHSACSKYLAYRAKMDDISKQRIQALKSGDYTAEFSLPNGETFSLENHALIERKPGLSEICGNFCQNRARFIREFERIRNAGAKAYIIVEGGANWEAIYNHRYHSQMAPQALVASLTAWMARYNAHIIFCRAETFPKLCREILYREAKEIFTNMEVDT